MKKYLRNNSLGSRRAMILLGMMVLFMGLLSATTTTTILNSPADLSNQTSMPITLSCNGTTDTGYLANVSLYTNQSGWLLNETNSTLDTTPTLNIYTATYGSTASITDMRGINFTMTSDASSITFSKYSDATPTKAFLYSASGTYLANATFSGDNATISYNFLNGISYIIQADKGGLSFGARYGSIGSKTLTTVNVVGGLYSAGYGNGSNFAFTVDASSHIFTNITTFTNSKSSIKNFSKNYNPSQSVLWNCRYCASDGTCAFAPANYTFNTNSLFFISETYSLTVMEGTNATFIINLLSSNALTIGNLSYNGTGNIGTINNTGNSYTITKFLSIPFVSANTNVTFFWSITDSLGTSINFTSHNQTITNFDIDNCTTNSIEIFNLSMKDEESQAFLNKTADNTSIKLDLTLSTISGIPLATYYKFYNQTLPARICINGSLGSSAFLIDAVIEYSATNYAKEFYNIQKYNLNGTSNPLQNITLYDLLSTKNQPFKITYRDTSSILVPDAIIQINRKYVEEGIFKIIEVPKTDAYGETIGNLELNDVIYTFNVIKNGVLLGTFSNVRVVCQTPSITECRLDLNSFSSTSTITNFTNDNDFSYILSTNRTLRTTTAQFTVPSGNLSTIVLNVSTTDALGTNICSQSITTNAGTLTCVYPAPIGNVTLIARLYKNGNLVGSGNVALSQLPKDIFGGTVVILAIFVLLTLIGAGISDSPVTTIIFFLIGVILLTAMNLVANTGFVFGATILFLVIAIILVIIKGVKRQ